MHMADALLSPAVGGTMIAASAAAIALSVKKIAGGGSGGGAGGPGQGADLGLDEKKVPLMGVLGAFVFAGQMINFTIPGTGSSGHIGGGILLAAVLGPFPALLALASVLLIQCLFFADGGLLAWGCNVFNMGVISCLLAYPFIFRPIVRGGLSKKRIAAASVLSVTAGLQLGALCVVLETLLSGVTELPPGPFLLLMQPIHLAIGVVEGLVTAAVLCYVHGLRPELLDSSLGNTRMPDRVPMGRILVSFIVLTVLVGGLLSIFASAYPDGLEWSMEGVAGTAELEREGGVYQAAGAAVEKTAFMPDYAFPGEGGSPAAEAAGTATAGLVGSLITVLAAGGLGLVIAKTRKKQAA
jgi:cobalt/nickel transport system permease protein